jgi:hypothetical protein
MGWLKLVRLMEYDEDIKLVYIGGVKKKTGIRIKKPSNMGARFWLPVLRV